tara:strand:- start:4605 stop:6758 length:2154 start_codon:yes stop_codon:yes gene_type:complete
MNTAVYNTISGYGLLDNYKVHYYFDKYTGGASNAHVYSDGASQYSGKIFSYEGGAHSSTALDLFTGNLGTGTFSGGLSNFHDYVSIQNYGDLFSGEFSILIGAQTTSRQDLGEAVKGPVSNNNILFSNFSGGGFTYSGWQMGINAANRAYVECYNGFDPLLLTYKGLPNPYVQNIWGLVFREGSLSLGLYDISTESFSFTSNLGMSGTMQPSSEWRIGSGINFDPNVKFSSQLTLNSGLFAGKMNNFVYFNTGLNAELINPIAKSLYSDLYEKTQPTYESGDTTFLYDSISGTGVTGVVGTTVSCSLTGTQTGYVPFTETVALTGSLSAGDTYYLQVVSGAHSISGIAREYRALYNTGSPLTGITGFTTVSHQTGRINYITGCSGATVTGVQGTISGVTGSGIGGFTGLLTSGVSGISGQPTPFLRPDAFSYIGTRLPYTGVIEKYNIGSFGTSDKGSLNNLAVVGEALDNEGQGFSIKKVINSGSLSTYLNGVGRELGGITFKSPNTSVVFYDANLDKTFAKTAIGILDKDTATPAQIKTYFNEYNIISGDYYLNDLNIMEDLSFSYRSANVLDIYDTGLNTGTIRSRWEVTGVSDYAAPPSPNPISGDQWVFFNGQKLVSGTNYIATTGFIPTGYITGTTGVYFTIPPVDGTTQITGNSLSFEGSPFFPNSNIIFINGVRQDVSEYYVEHTQTKDLISGKETLKTYGITLYNNYN